MGDEAALPGDDTNLENAYTAQNVTDVATSDGTRVEQTGTGEYMIHQFKDFVGSQTSVTLTCIGQSSLASDTSTVYLEIYNQNTTDWDLVDSDSSTAADTNFTLTGAVADLTNYKDGRNVISCRVYQLAT